MVQVPLNNVAVAVDPQTVALALPFVEEVMVATESHIVVAVLPLLVTIATTLMHMEADLLVDMMIEITEVTGVPLLAMTKGLTPLSLSLAVALLHVDLSVEVMHTAYPDPVLVPPPPWSSPR